MLTSLCCTSEVAGQSGFNLIVFVCEFLQRNHSDEGYKELRLWSNVLQNFSKRNFSIF